MNPGDIMVIYPWDKYKSCPKCDHSNLMTGTYYPAAGCVPEHLYIQCACCGHEFRMKPKS